VCEEVILEHEERLRRAQLTGDVAALDELIADDLQFVLHDGSVCTKQMDLDAHRAGVFKFMHIEFSEQRITRSGDVAVVTTRARLAGTSSGQPFKGEMRYLRTWMNRDGRWRIVAGSVNPIPR
jgi:ketosteroid isomerase-like protein